MKCERCARYEDMLSKLWLYAKTLQDQNDTLRSDIYNMFCVARDAQDIKEPKRPFTMDEMLKAGLYHQADKNTHDGT